MTPSPSDLSGLLNLPDLIVLLFLLWSVWNGARRGFVAAAIGFVGRIAVAVGACWLAKSLAPTLAGAVVAPLFGETFAAQTAENPALAAALSRLQLTVAEAVQHMAEGAAFLLLAVIFLLVLSVALSLLMGSLHLLTRFPPLGWLNRLAGAAFGLVSGGAAVLVLLWCARLVCPDLFSDLGWLSPARVQATVLLRGLLTYIPL